MKTHFTINKVKKNDWKPVITRVVTKWTSNYIKAMRTVLYPSESEGIENKNDVHRIFYK
ncbi:hypothetical protein [Aquimarina sp. 2201CG5-10]|uniref:hypothetical protein n=1 Tax=Aquimarina callyspongiae TaxID=3098150 RepID=UPI002AB4805D|nr:hypothetical protein [Aquimarina sp. 2201CG5-10]MDY8134631.1 hypothetical protein [Aquimarina sp. 2201CG5-10]